MTTQGYLAIINKKFKSGIAKEHAYRTDLENLILQLAKDVEIINEPVNVTDCGNPDYVITKNKIPVGYIEVKDIGKNLNGKHYKEQFTRYKKALDNLIISDYIWFQFFQNGELVHEIKIGEISGNTVKAIPRTFAKFETLIQDFCTFIGQTIKSPKKLAVMMASKARLLQNILETAISSDEEIEENTALKDQYEAFKSVLIHDLKPKEFADIYAQTLAYGMFAARLHDTSLNTFTRQEAAELIPKTNPFLRKLFQGVAGYDIDPRIKTTVDNLVEVFRATDVNRLLQNFGQEFQTNDPIIHFYETFLAEYDPKLRKARGVWYTPEPVVNFIVRAVDDILKTDFDLPMGLADTGKTRIKIKTQTPDKRTTSGYKEIEREVHKVQILDPAAGTGTFLAEVVKHIYSKNFKAMQGAWSSYAEKHLIPRLNGFELLMASYAMAHLKLDMLLTETGYKPKKEKRFNIYLTNSLEEYHPDTGTLFASWLGREANEANHVKRDTPVMVVLGNPPYSVSSSNASVGTDGRKTWIGNLLDDYKKELNEKKLNLDDDYIKFIRYGHYLIDKNGEGILAYISNNSFIDGVTHRQMRLSLMNTFTDIYIINLHGSSMRLEQCPDGSKDENVFDIRQGVSIGLFVKKTEKRIGKRQAKIHYFDLWGGRQAKYDTLIKTDSSKVAWTELRPEEPWYFFVPKEKQSMKKYDAFKSMAVVFKLFGNGIGTDRDSLFYDFDAKVLSKRIENFYSDNGLTSPFSEYYRVKDSSSYPLLSRRETTMFSAYNLSSCLYRPFDIRQLYYNPHLISRPAYGVMQHFQKPNIALLITRQVSTGEFRHVFVSKHIIDRDPLSLATRERTQVFPLYLYHNTNGQQSFENNTQRIPNLNPAIIEEFAAKMNMSFTPEKDKTTSTFSSIDIFDYIYAVLHSPTYRHKYKEFLKIDFPRVPYPPNAGIFWRLVKFGEELRQIHLLESPKVEEYITKYPYDGDNTITRKLTATSPGFELTNSAKQTGKVWINDQQYFDNVPIIAWEFYIGGYQPAQKWLKDRASRQLSFEDILHYQKIIVALTETTRLMKEIDNIYIG